MALAAPGDLEGAATAFQQVIGLAPSAVSHAFLAGLRVNQGRLPEAVTEYEQALPLLKCGDFTPQLF